ncbi:alpha/beta fold hydrolase [Ideonella alba]|uniref:Alpha/beta fold hydrolase n=1 Tax=Ideonella alba TaxID=2824118 RepID=A0A940YDZ0_9BURK|nr:alpha/beta fold hydrolase [Ideonella alba]MBQ0932845.1 alpha/beta fold hydrolase [Ideonella alba]
MLSVLLRAFGILLMLTAVALPLARAPDRSPESLVARWAPRPSELVDVGGLMVHLRDEGPRNDPTPLLFIHGLGSSLHTWEGWASALRAQRRVIRFDLPGAGLTGPFPEPQPQDYRSETLARFTLQLMDQLKLRQVVLVGHSLGGEVAWQLASRSPERISRLVLLDATGLAIEPLEVPPGLRLARVPVLGWLGQSLLPRGVVEATLEAVYADPRRLTPELVDRHFELLLRDGNRQALRQALLQQQPGRDVERLASLRLPTLLLWGEKDRVVPPAAGAEFARRIPGAQFQVLAGLGHAPHEELPARSLGALQAFLPPR